MTVCTNVGKWLCTWPSRPTLGEPQGFRCGEMAVHTTLLSNPGWTSGFQQVWGNGCARNPLTQPWVNLRLSAGVGKCLCTQPPHPTSGFQQAWGNRVSAGVGKWLYMQPNPALDKTFLFFIFLAEEPKQRNPQWERHSVRNHCTFHQSHAQLAGHKAAVRTQTYVHAALDGLNVISVCGISPCRYIQTTVISLCNRLQPVALPLKHGCAMATNAQC